MIQRDVNIIPVDQCVRGGLYKIRSRNLEIGVFDGSRGFIGIRTKFNSRFLDTEYHWDTDKHHGTATPLELITQCPIEPLATYLETVCGKCDRLIRKEGEVGNIKNFHADDGTPICERAFPTLKANKPLFEWIDAELNKFLGRIMAPEKLNDMYREAARNEHASDVIEFDDDATVSVSSDGGAWVQGWLWVNSSSVGLSKEQNDAFA